MSSEFLFLDVIDPMNQAAVLTNYQKYSICQHNRLIHRIDDIIT